MCALRRHLSADGRLVLTLHNPPVRQERLHEEWRDMGRFPLGGGRTVALRSRWWREGPERAAGEQHYVEADSSGAILRELILPIRFDLVQPQEIRELSAKAGLRVDRVLGDYQGAPFAPSTSPFALFELVAA